MPSAAAKLSSDVTAAVSGIRIEWKSSMRARKPSPTTSSRNSGSAAESTPVKSSSTASAPPT